MSELPEITDQRGRLTAGNSPGKKPASEPAIYEEQQDLEVTKIEKPLATNKVAPDATKTPSKEVTLEKIKEVIGEKVEKFDPKEAAKEGSKSKWQGSSMGFFELCKKADPAVRCYFYTAIFFSMIVGMNQPMLFLILGRLIDNLGKTSANVETLEGNEAAQKRLEDAELSPDQAIDLFAPSEEGEDPMAFMRTIAYVQMIMAASFFVLFTIANFLYNTFAEKLARKVQVEYFEACLHKDAAFYDDPKQVPTEMPSKIASETEAIKAGMGDKNDQIWSSLFMSLGGFAVGFTLGPELAGICMGFLPVFACGTVIIMGGYAKGLIEIKKSYSQSAGYAEQALQAIKVVHTYGQEKLEARNYGKYLTRSYEAQQKFNRSMAFGIAFFMSLIFAFYGYSFIFGGLLRVNEVKNVISGTYTGGTIISVMNCIMIGCWSISGIFTNVQVLMDARIAARMAYDVIDKEVEVDSNAPGIEVTNSTLRGDIEFKNVNFSYPTRANLKVMVDFSINIEAGKTTALVGPSGSGKSTIIQLLERYYKPKSGEILLDGKPIEQYQLKQLRRCIGYVGQEPVLFNTTIKQNMLYANPYATDTEIIDCLKMANAWSFVKDLKEGINEQVGASGSMLSGGQKQRIAIARAFVKKPRILLLDEATSALDKMNERAVQEAIDRFRKEVGNVTIITIAHRLSTIRDADQILVIKDGKLTEKGNHEQLLENYPKGVYAGFCEKQAAAEEVPEEEDLSNIDSPELKKQLSKKKTIPKTVEKDGQILEVMISQEEQDMLDSADAKDKEMEEKNAEILKAATANGVFTRLYDLSNPKYLIATGILGAFFVGGAQPIWAIFYSRAITYMTVPLEFVPFAFADQIKDDEDGKDFVIRQNNYTIIAAVVIGIFHGYGFWQRIGSFGVLSENLTLEIRKLLYIKMLRKNIGWFDDRSRATSVLTSTMQNDTGRINEAGTTSLQPIISALCCFILAIAISFYFCWPMAAGALAIMPFQVCAMYYAFKTQHGFMGKVNEESKEANLGLGDAILNYKTVQSFGHENLLVQNFIESMKPADEAAFRGNMAKALALGVCTFINLMVSACMFLIGGAIVSSDRFNYDMGSVFTALFAMMFSGQQIGTSLGNGPDFGKAEISARQVFDITDQPSQIDAIEMDDENVPDKNIPKEGIIPTNIKGKIEFVEVWFRYPSRKQDFVLKGLSLVIEPNESVALVGESGCGKSTCVNLLMRFYDPDDGCILLDGVDIREYNLHEYRKAISMVMQEPIIFNYSILDNILYSKLDAKNSEIYEAAELANCNEFITNQYEREEHNLEDEPPKELLSILESRKKELTIEIGEEQYENWVKTIKQMVAVEEKKGLFTYHEGDVDTRSDSLKDIELSKGFNIVTGYKGSKLSGGQKQRVAIARTIIRKPAVLLLDEATSALDEDSQKKVQLALENASANRTTIVIAHRMSTIERCSKIFVLEYGTVKESGNFKDLQNQGGLFAKISEAKQTAEGALDVKFQKTEL